MSVINFGKEEWQKLFNTLAYMHKSNSLYHRIKFLDRNEVKSIAELFFKNDIEKTEEYLIALMVSKLAYANRLCFGYQYELQKGQKAEIEPLELDDPNMDTYNHRELVRRIQSIRYNCCSNGGSEFIPKDIEEKLDIILITCAGILAKEEE